jgi:hypothetical protein
MPTPPSSGGAAAGRIADALGTPNVISGKGYVTAFVVRRFVDCGLLVDLSANPDGTLHHPDQLAEACRREDLADLVAADTPLGPEQAAARHRVRRVDFNHMVRLGWVRSSRSRSASAKPSRGRRRRALHHRLRPSGDPRPPPLGAFDGHERRLLTASWRSWARVSRTSPRRLLPLLDTT